MESSGKYLKTERELRDLSLEEVRNQRPLSGLRIDVKR
jgi:hypothetical protein